MKPGWRKAAFNDGWAYRDRVPTAEAGIVLSDWLARRYLHSAAELWLERIVNGELDCDGQRLEANRLLQGGESILWRRPPWLEPAIPDQWETIHDNGDLLVINKPSGLPVMPGGGFLRHTLSALLEPSKARPVHRLGRFTSGLQVCARSPQTRALWSRQFRPDGDCRKVYQAWSRRVPGLELGQCLTLSSDVVERPHPLLGWIWGPEPLKEQPIRNRLPAHSKLELLERTAEGDRLQVTITTAGPIRSAFIWRSWAALCWGIRCICWIVRFRPQQRQGMGGIGCMPGGWWPEDWPCSHLFPPTGGFCKSLSSPFLGMFDGKSCGTRIYISGSLWRVL